MRLYLVQHGTAVPKDKDPERPLSKAGQTDVSRVASFLGRSGVHVARVLHSGKLRAQETALLLAEVISPGRLVEESAAPIGPNEATDKLIAFIESWPDADTIGDIMVVGHLPFMSKIVSQLVVTEQDTVVVHFQPGTVVALERGENGGGWTISWVMRPELLGG